MPALDKKIMIVDDDEFLLDMYAVKFRESGFEVDISKGGEEVLEKLRAGLRPNAILLDIVMPGKDGFEVLRIMKQENLAQNAVIAILTNLGQKEDVEKGIRLGANDYIVKAHFTPSEVVKRILELLDKK